jgi:hypothetical protein
MPQTFVKDPAAVLDYAVSWIKELTGVSPQDEISSSSWAKDNSSDAIVIDGDSVNGSNLKASVTLSGGVAGETYTLTNTIITAAARTDERSIKIICRDR